MEPIIVADETEVIQKLWQVIEETARNSIAESGIFRIGLSGGSLIKFMAAGASRIQTNWSKWKLFFCDERFVEENDEDSTFGQYKKLFIPKTPLKENQFLTIDTSQDLLGCAHAYERGLYQAFGIEDLDFRTIPRFDLLLIGLGPDGHICSLFPNHKLLLVDHVLIAPIDDSPKPPPKRITMTYPLINNAKLCVFALSGSGKAEIIKEVSRNDRLPPRLIKPIDGKVMWIVDKAAASLL